MFENLINVLFPKVCVGCNTFLLSNEKVICTVCRHEIPLTNHHLNPENEAFKKFYGKIPVEFTSTLVYYHKKGIVQEMIHSLKYRGHEEIGTILGDWHAEDLKRLPVTSTFDAIIPVPLHKKRLKERGYNQVTTFGLALSDNLNITYDTSILRRNIYSKTQVKKNLLKRTEVVGNIFEVEFTDKDHNKHFLLIDDVLTTGSTLEACGRALLKIPGAKISIVCMAMSHS
ncbi:ComF family protein [Flavobacterium psychrotolerans]|uniref:Amidophosphoribosyltransferase n=1 Tax=Flavobacterium psychrotolerans TaxID=2169410 RepID=A0A2U1JNB8_9FLAO|nr:phosphoribosyltransferase family protein [Flavobacterium psychrotolerans]PWA06622.1 amidophosphoribosyltransferase [Flavobacterium psychrotolerans]